MSLPYDSAIDEEAVQKSAFIVEFHSITFEGLCPGCAAVVPRNGPAGVRGMGSRVQGV
jgi:hypothetical protein